MPSLRTLFESNHQKRKRELLEMIKQQRPAGLEVSLKDPKQADLIRAMEALAKENGDLSIVRTGETATIQFRDSIYASQQVLEMLGESGHVLTKDRVKPWHLA